MRVKARIRRKLLTAEELFRLSTSGRRYELVKGELYDMSPEGARHGGVAMEAATLLGAHVNANQLGRVFAAETGFIVRRDPDTIRAPDVAFVAKDRLPPPPRGGLPVGFMDLAPDLAVEVLSPTDRPPEVRDKVEEWLRAGTRLVWLIDPAAHTVTVYRAPDDPQLLSEDATLDGVQVVPGFACRVRELFV